MHPAPCRSTRRFVTGDDSLPGLEHLRSSLRFTVFDYLSVNRRSLVLMACSLFGFVSRRGGRKRCAAEKGQLCRGWQIQWQVGSRFLHDA